MRCKHIARVGTILITALILIATLMYYFHQDKCPTGTFSCANSTLCLPQKSICNNQFDCPEGDDENVVKCLELEDFPFDYFYNLINENSSINCYNITEEYYSSCDYNNNTCSVVCNNYFNHEIPQTFTKILMKLSFTNSSLPALKKEFFQRYTKLERLYLSNNGIVVLEDHTFFYQQILKYLTLAGNNIREITEGHLVGLVSLETLNLANNRIHTLDLKDLENSTALNLLDASSNILTTSNISLPYLPALNELLLDENRLEAITEDLLSRLPALTSLNLNSNFIEYISPNAFKNLHELKELTLMSNKIAYIPPDLFMSVRNLSTLAIGYNRIKYLSTIPFEPLKNSLHILGVEEIDMDCVDKNLFSMLPYLENIYFAKFHHCTTYAPNVRICHPNSDGVSSLSHLLERPLLKVAVWGISCVTCLGNVLVLWGRFTAKDENRVLSTIIRNLAVSDLLMGVYLLTIGIQDIRFHNNYSQEARGWMNSWSCTLIGMIAMISSEVSVLILSFMSVERFMLIAAPFKGQRAITPQTAASSMIVIWVIGIILAVFPAIHWRSSTRFYGLNGMCFPLHIEDPFVVGWEYSAFIFLGMNLVGLVTIGCAYAGMFMSIWKTRHATPLSLADTEFALRFFLIVLTDIVCWAPIVILKIMALAEYPVSPDLHAWVVVFILPVNSAVNPLLYTFTTPKFRERLSEGWFGKVKKSIASKKQSRSGSQTSYTCATNKNTVSSSRRMSNDEETLKQSLNDTLLIDFTVKSK